MPDNNWVQQQAAARAREMVYEAICEYLDREGRSPLRQEVADATGLPLPTVKRHVTSLLNQGRLHEAGPRTLSPI